MMFNIFNCNYVGGTALHGAEVSHSLVADTPLQAADNAFTDSTNGDQQIARDLSAELERNSVNVDGSGETRKSSEPPVRGSAWEPYLRGAHSPAPQENMFARIRPWLSPKQWAHSLASAFSSKAVLADAARQALRMRRGWDSDRGGAQPGYKVRSPGEVGEGMHGFNQSDMAQLLPVDVAWMMAEEVRMHKDPPSSSPPSSQNNALFLLSQIAAALHSRLSYGGIIPSQMLLWSRDRSISQQVYFGLDDVQGSAENLEVHQATLPS